MTTYWLSFEIKEANVAGRSSGKRRSELYSMIDAMVIPRGDPSIVWKDTTSFVLFKSGRGIGEIASSLKSVISQHHDLFLIRKLDFKSAIICGQLDNENIFDLMSTEGKTYLTDITDESAMTGARMLSAGLRHRHESGF